MRKEVLKEHEYFLKESKNQRMTKALETYKCNPIINILFNGKLTNEMFCEFFIKMNSDKCGRGEKISNYNDMYDFLYNYKMNLVNYFDVNEMDKSFHLKLKKDIIVYRGGVDEGGIFRGYTSTTLSGNIAYKFLKRNKIYYKIKIPKGFEYIYLEMNRENKKSGIISNFPFEYEILLPRGCTYKVNSIKKRKVENPHYEYEKRDPFIIITIHEVEITGIKKIDPKITLVY